MRKFCWTARLAWPSHGAQTAAPAAVRPGSSGVEQRTENPRVGGSNPPPGTIIAAVRMSVPGARSMTAQEPDAFAAALRRKIDGKTKPLGALGRIEELAARIAPRQGTLEPRMRELPAHDLRRRPRAGGGGGLGLSAGGDAADAPELPRRQRGRQRLRPLGRGGAARRRRRRRRRAGRGIRGSLSRRIGAGTRNARHEPAMSAAERDRGARGRAGARRRRRLGRGLLRRDGHRQHLGGGAARAQDRRAAARAASSGAAPGSTTPALARKRAVLEAAAARTAAPLPADAALAEYGGFEIAMMAGAMLGAAAAGRIVIVDGFIAGAAALVAIGDGAGGRAAPSSSRTARPSTATRRCSRTSAPSRCSTSACGSARAPARCSPGRWSGRRRRCSTEMSSFESAGVSGPA